ncbi:hypothetical protein SteCoe_4432 [Stentor coeruleus]|uniref:Uncharacterized protein n=1 Tax=Stentor coeruleus TaxID=5963 RepID=A0A1R2CV01_9CILI|nr:hypothetical protein SteCoe_4432 [Stentor coeruleus]
MSYKKFQRSIPSKYAEKVVETEISIEKHCTIEAVKSLLQLYIEGIEYYEAIGDEKYLYYKSKMDKLLCSKRDFLRPKRDMNAEKEAEAIIKNYELNAMNVTSKIHNNFLEQNCALSDRVNSRKQINRRSFAPGSFSKLYDINDIQTKISEAIEELVQAEMQLIKESKKKYQKILTKDNCIEAVNMLNDEVERIKSEFSRKKKAAISQILSNDC